MLPVMNDWAVPWRVTLGPSVPDFSLPVAASQPLTSHPLERLHA